MNEFEPNEARISRVIRSSKALRNGCFGALLIIVLAVLLGSMSTTLAIIGSVVCVLLARQAHSNMRKTQSLYDQE